jgi:hypothetical protein
VPAANCSVAIRGHPVVLTNQQGVFQIPNVTTPYDLAAVNSGQKRAVIYKGLTIANPYVFFYGYTPGTVQVSGTVSGTLSNTVVVDPALPYPRATYASVTFGSTAPSPSAYGGVLATGLSPATYSFSGADAIAWYGPGSTTGTLDALQWSIDSRGLPTGDWRYGSRPNVSLAAGAALPNQNITLSPQAPTSITGSVTVSGSNSSLYQKLVAIDFPSGGQILTVVDQTGDTNLSYPTPSMATSTATATVVAIAVQDVPTEADYNAAYAYRSNLATNASNVSIVVQAPPSLANPVAGGADIDYQSEFLWSPFEGSLQIVVIDPATTDDPHFAIFTMDQRTTIPDLAAWGLSGMGLPHTVPQTGYQWYVIAYGPWSSVDDAAGPGLFMPSGNTLNYGATLTRDFTVR